MSTLGNSLKTGGLFAGMLALFAAIGFLLGGFFGSDPYSGMLVFLLIAAVLNLVTLFWGDKMILKAYKAKQVTEAEAPGLHSMVGRVAVQAGLPRPDIYIVDSQTPNAFATGRSPEHGKVAFTTGIINLLDKDELEGVAAHEIAHIHNRDMLVMTVASTLAAAIGFAVRMAMFQGIFGGRDARQALPILILLAVTAPIAAMLVQTAISRTREFRADKAAAGFTGDPRSLARALEKLDRGNKAKPMEGGNPAHASLFIANPFSGGALTKLFSTHPPMEERVQRLNEMAY